MNILPKKRWHVRTRENIARVRKDEQEAAEECEEKKQRILKAEQEARRNFLRQRARTKYGIPDTKVDVEEPHTSKHEEINTEKHVNFFQELEEGKATITKTNPETELEEKEKREKYEKQIGYLTYLGQDTVESTGNIPWYDKVPNRLLTINECGEEKSSKTKLLQDPLQIIKKYVPTEARSVETSHPSKKKSSLLGYHSIHKREKKKKYKNKSKKRRKRHSSCSASSTNNESASDEEEKFQKRKSLEQLRAERLKREKEERERTEQLLARLQGKDLKEPKVEPKIPVLQQKYNSQYNPELAKQNFPVFPKNS